MRQNASVLWRQFDQFRGEATNQALRDELSPQIFVVCRIVIILFDSLLIFHLRYRIQSNATPRDFDAGGNSSSNSSAGNGATLLASGDIVQRLPVLEVNGVVGNE